MSRSARPDTAPQTPTVSAELRTELIAFRRELHAFPEIGLRVPRSRDLVLERLAGLGLEVTIGTGLDSVTAVLRGAHPGPSILLRAELDALPVQESLDLPFASQIPGAMHACGHDVNAAMLLGATHLLAGQRQHLAGNVVLMFQPGEEGHRGGALMVEEGVLEAGGETVSAAYAVHVVSGGTPSGVFTTRPGEVTASADRLTIRVRGRGGHASAPQLARDPLQPACAMVLALSSAVGRRTDPFSPAVLSIGAIHGGQAPNVIPEYVDIAGTIRCLTDGDRTALLEAVVQTCEGIATAYGVEVDVETRAIYPRTVNDAGAADAVRHTVATLFGEARWAAMEHPLTGSEDFAYVLDHVPGAITFLGATPAGRDPMAAPYNHAPDAAFDDGLIADGARLLAALALGHLSPPE